MPSHWSGALFGCLFVRSSPCRKWPNTQKNGCWLPPSDHIQSENLFQIRQDQEKGMNGPASLLHSWRWELICLDEITFCKSGHFEDSLWYIKAMTTYMISWCEWYATNNNAAGKLPLPEALWVWINGSSIYCWWRWRGTLEHFICNKKREEVLFAFHSK